MNRYYVREVAAFNDALIERRFVCQCLPEADGIEVWSKANISLYWKPNVHNVPVYYVMVTAEFGPFADALYSTLRREEALALGDLLEREVGK